MLRRLLLLLALNAVLLHHTVFASEDDGYDDDYPMGDEDYPMDDAYGGDGYGDDGYGGGYGDGEMPPPPPPLQELSSLEEFDNFIDHEDASVIGAFASEDDEALADFKEIAQSMQYDWRWAQTTSSEVLQKLKVKNSALFVYRSPRFLSEKHGERKRERFPSSKLNEGAVKNWLLTHSQPLVGQYTYTSKDRYMAMKLPVVIVFFNINWEGDKKGTAYYINRARKVAANFVGKLSFSVAAIKDFEYQLDDFGLKTEDTLHDVRIGLLHKEGNEELYYGCDSQKFSVDVLTTFANSYLAGELEPSKRQDLSAPPPSGDDDDNVDESEVVTLTSRNFDEVVRDTSKDVLVEFYAPWCGHCKALKPEYAKAAQMLKGKDSLVLAKMDATEHNPPKDFDVQGYPTIYFVPAGENAKAVPYEGEREGDAIAKWVQSHAVSLK